MVTQTFVANLNRISPAEASALIKSLYQFHDTVFDGVDEKAFFQAMLNPHSRLNKVKVWKDGSGRIFAYCALHRADLHTGSGLISVFKVEVAVSGGQRGRALAKNFIGLNFLAHFLRRPLRKTYFISAFVHPASYRMAAGSIWKLYPSWRRLTPPSVELLMNELADKLDYVRNDERPWTRKVGWISKDDNEELHEYWKTHPDADIRFFLERNPDYRRGNGLLSVMPFTLSNIAMSAAIRQGQRTARLLGLRRRDNKSRFGKGDHISPGAAH